MRVFVLSTGRTGSVTLSHACKHITNFTSAHESTRGKVGALHFPENHIEIDPHLVFNIGSLKKMYPDAVYVHLKRERRPCVESLKKRASMRTLWIPHAYQKNGKHVTPEDIDISANLFYSFFNDVIAEFCPYAFKMNLENFKNDFTSFWQKIGAEGDLRAALAEFNTKYNAGPV